MFLNFVEDSKFLVDYSPTCLVSKNSKRWCISEAIASVAETPFGSCCLRPCAVRRAKRSHMREPENRRHIQTARCVRCQLKTALFGRWGLLEVVPLFRTF